jgi:hypothetical protein
MTGPTEAKQTMALSNRNATVKHESPDIGKALPLSCPRNSSV